MQCPAVSTTVCAINVPEQRNLPAAVVKRTTPTFVCVVSGPPPVMARAGAVATTPAARATTTSPLSVRFRVRAILHSQFD